MHPKIKTITIASIPMISLLIQSRLLNISISNQESLQFGMDQVKTKLNPNVKAAKNKNSDNNMFAIEIAPSMEYSFTENP